MRIQILRSITPLCLSAGLLACSNADDGGLGGMFGTSDTTASTGPTSSETTAVPETGDGDGDSTGPDTATSDGPLLDIGGDGSTTADGNPDGSCDKVDILFVIDNSGSMSDEQASLLAAFPDFANAMVETLDTVISLHVGVTSSGEVAVNTPDTCAINGALLTKPMCTPFVDGNRFITEADDIVEAFACNAVVGTNGPVANKTMLNLIDSVSAMDGAGECNEDFIRDDALLVVVIITDENDRHSAVDSLDGSPGEPSTWIADVTAAKDDIETNVVVISFVQPPLPNVCPPANLEWAGYQADRIIEFTNGFSNSLVHDICDFDGYTAAFEMALGYIDEACDSFVPPG